MKSKVISITVVTVIVLLIVAFFVNSKISEMQNQIDILRSQNDEAQEKLNEYKDQISDLQIQNREQQDRLKDFTYQLALQRRISVKITGFDWLGSLGFTGLMAIYSANVTVQNNDVVPLSGLKVVIRLFDVEGEETASSGNTIERISVGQHIEIRNTQLASRVWFMAHGFCDVFVTVGDLTLDKATFSF